MTLTYRRSTLIASTALSLSLAAWSAEANPALPGLTNLDFTSVANPPKGAFTTVAPTGWSGGGGLIYVDSPVAGADAVAAVPGTIATYGNPSGSVPGNYVEADGNPHFESGFNTTVTGLTPGQAYTLSFYQGASQQVGFSGDTTNQWIVALGGVGSTLYSKNSISGLPDTNCGTNCAYADTDLTASIAASDLMHIPSHGTVGWNFVSVDLTANATTEVLSFLAWGDNGNTTNLPPMAFLAGVDSPPGLGVPEPASMALFGVGLAGLGAVARRRRAKR
jgi:hypothetical protein